MNALRISTASKLLALALLCLIRAPFAFGSHTSHGDAVLVDEHGGIPLFPAPADHLDFPKTSLSAARTYRYRVVGLPQVIYPSAFLLDVPEQEADFGVRLGHPWSRCVVRASLISPRGVVFHSRTYHLGRDRHGTQERSHGRSTLGFPFTDYSLDGTTRLPHHLSYTLELQVIRPSTRPSDTLRVDAFTVVHPKRPNQAMQRTAPRSLSPIRVATTSNLQSHALSGAVADLVSR